MGSQEDWTRAQNGRLEWVGGGVIVHFRNCIFPKSNENWSCIVSDGDVALLQVCLRCIAVDRLFISLE